MARDDKDKERKVDEEDEASPEETESEAADGGEDALARADGAEDQATDEPEGGGESALAKRETEEGDEEQEGEGEEEAAAANLGVKRYVLAGFFASGMLGAYVLGRALQLVWTTLSNKDWFSRAVPRLAAVGDDDKGTLALVIAGIVALIVVVRTYRKPEVNTWAYEVAAELTKVKWPTRKEVTNSTIIVIAASAAATVYLALLDRLWAFVTNIVYGGDGS